MSHRTKIELLQHGRMVAFNNWHEFESALEFALEDLPLNTDVTVIRPLAAGERGIYCEAGFIVTRRRIASASAPSADHTGR